MLTQTAIRATAPPAYFAAPPEDRVVNGRPPRDLLATILHLMGAVVSYRRNTELFGEKEPADYLYKVVSGGGFTPTPASEVDTNATGFADQPHMTRCVRALTGAPPSIWRSQVL